LDEQEYRTIEQKLFHREKRDYELGYSDRNPMIEVSRREGGTQIYVPSPSKEESDRILEAQDKKRGEEYLHGMFRKCRGAGCKKHIHPDCRGCLFISTCPGCIEKVTHCNIPFSNFSLNGEYCSRTHRVGKSFKQTLYCLDCSMASEEEKKEDKKALTYSRSCFMDHSKYRDCNKSFTCAVRKNVEEPKSSVYTPERMERDRNFQRSLFCEDNQKCKNSCTKSCKDGCKLHCKSVCTHCIRTRCPLNICPKCRKVGVLCGADDCVYKVGWEKYCKPFSSNCVRCRVGYKDEHECPVNSISVERKRKEDEEKEREKQKQRNSYSSTSSSSSLASYPDYEQTEEEKETQIKLAEKARKIEKLRQEKIKSKEKIEELSRTGRFREAGPEQDLLNEIAEKEFQEGENLIDSLIESRIGSIRQRIGETDEGVTEGDGEESCYEKKTLIEYEERRFCDDPRGEDVRLLQTDVDKGRKYYELKAPEVIMAYTEDYKTLDPQSNFDQMRTIGDYLYWAEIGLFDKPPHSLVPWNEKFWTNNMDKNLKAKVNYMLEKFIYSMDMLVKHLNHRESIRIRAKGYDDDLTYKMIKDDGLLNFYRYSSRLLSEYVHGRFLELKSKGCEPLELKSNLSSSFAPREYVKVDEDLVQIPSLPVPSVHSRRLTASEVDIRFELSRVLTFEEVEYKRSLKPAKVEPTTISALLEAVNQILPPETVTNQDDKPKDPRLYNKDGTLKAPRRKAERKKQTVGTTHSRMKQDSMCMMTICALYVTSLRIGHTTLSEDNYITVFNILNCRDEYEKWIPKTDFHKAMRRFTEKVGWSIEYKFRQLKPLEAPSELKKKRRERILYEVLCSSKYE